MLFCGLKLVLCLDLDFRLVLLVGVATIMVIDGGGGEKEEIPRNSFDNIVDANSIVGIVI